MLCNWCGNKSPIHEYVIIILNVMNYLSSSNRVVDIHFNLNGQVPVNVVFKLTISFRKNMKMNKFKDQFIYILIVA